MSITPYDRASWATFTPMSAQEILMPAMQMREQHDKLDEQYGLINDEMERISAIAANDPELNQRVESYRELLGIARDELMNRGINSNSKRRALDLRGRYSSQLKPIDTAYQMHQEWTKELDAKRLQDPTWRGTDPRSVSISDIINNNMQLPQTQGASAAMVTAATEQSLKNIQNIAQDPEFRTRYAMKVGEENVPMFIESIQRNGLNPNSENPEERAAAQAALEVVREQVFGTFGIAPVESGGWANNEDMYAFNQAVNLAQNSMIGQNRYSHTPNPGLAHAMKLQEAKAKAAATAASNNPYNLPEMTAQPNRVHTNNVNAQRQEFMESPEWRKMSGERINPVGNGFAIAAVEEAQRVLRETEGMTPAQLAEYREGKKFTMNTVMAGGNTGYVQETSHDITDRVWRTVEGYKDAMAYQQSIRDAATEWGLTTMQAKELIDSYNDSTNNLATNVLRTNHQASEKGEMARLRSAQSSVASNRARTIYRNDRAIDWDDLSKEEKDSARDPKNIIGHNSYNPSLGASTAVVEFIDDKGRTVSLEVADSELTSQYNMTNQILNAIHQSQGPWDAPVNINGQTYTKRSKFNNGAWQHFLVDSEGTEIPVEHFLKIDQNNVRNSFYNRSTSIPQGKYIIGPGGIPQLVPATSDYADDDFMNDNLE